MVWIVEGGLQERNAMDDSESGVLAGDAGFCLEFAHGCNFDGGKTCICVMVRYGLGREIGR